MDLIVFWLDTDDTKAFPQCHVNHVVSTTQLPKPKHRTLVCDISENDSNAPSPFVYHSVNVKLGTTSLEYATYAQLVGAQGGFYLVLALFVFIIACYSLFVWSFRLFASWLVPLRQYSSSKFPSFYPPPPLYFNAMTSRKIPNSAFIWVILAIQVSTCLKKEAASIVQRTLYRPSMVWLTVSTQLSIAPRFGALLVLPF